MSRDGDLLPHDHLLTGGREGDDGNSGVVWMHRAVAIPRCRHVPGRFCPCSPIPVTQDEMSRPGWWGEEDTADLLC